MRILPNIALLLVLALAGASKAYPVQAKAPAATPQPDHAKTASPQGDQKPQADSKEWIKRSNYYALTLLKIQAKYAPEFAGRQGVEGLDEQISQFPAGRREQQKADSKAALTQLQQALTQE